ncbi:MAG: hypothetical protein IJ619_13470 [Eubacterium sp.]|nr:hypothetical protein [Eubacterium sp.]
MILAGKRGFIKDKFRIKTIQQAIPGFRTHESGIFEFQGGIYSATYRLKDTDFTSESEAEQEDFFKRYSDILNSLDTKSTYKITIFNRNINYKKTRFIELPTNMNDSYDHIRSEYNAMRRKNREMSHGKIQEKYLTVTAPAKNAELAEQYFDRVERDFSRRFSYLGSDLSSVGINERLEIFYDYYRCGQEQYYDYDDATAKKRRSGYKDYICPSTLRFRNFDFEMGSKYGRVLFVREWGVKLKPEVVTRIMELKANMMFSIDIIPFSAEEVRRILEDAEMSAESNVDRWSQRPGAEKRRYSILPQSMRKDRDIVDAYSVDVNDRNQKIFYASITITILADCMTELDSFTESVVGTAAECGCQVEKMGFQQREGLNTVLPFGPRYTEMYRDCTTEMLAAWMPFNSVSINHLTGIPYGVHEETRQEVLIDRRLLNNGNEWVVGVSGCGKSFRVKLTALMEALITNGDILFVDPHGEFTGLTKALGGTVVKLGGASDDVINAMDMAKGYSGGGNDINTKLSQLTSLFHALLDREYTRPMDSIMVRCAKILLEKYAHGDYVGVPPTLVELYNLILSQEEQEAKRLALLIEPYVFSLKCFCGVTNVDIYNRIVCYDLTGLDENLWDASMSVVMDSIKNRLIINREAQIPTYIKIDEVGRFLDDPFLTQTFESFYAEVRKYGGFITGIVQNASKLLRNERARNMLSNAEIVVMLRQSSMDAMELKNIYKLSKTQVDRLVMAEEGCGIFKSANNFINFDGRIEKGYIYDLANTKPDHSKAMLS